MRTFLAGVIVVLIGLVCAAGWGYGVFSKNMHIARLEAMHDNVERVCVVMRERLQEVETYLSSLQAEGEQSDRIEHLKKELTAGRLELTTRKAELAALEQEIAAAEELMALQFLFGGE